MNNNFIPIVKSALEGDNLAFETLYNMTKDKAYFVALNITQNEQDAEDILHNSYIEAFQSLSTLHKPEVFDNWFNKIVSNNAKDYIKKKKPVLFADTKEFEGEWIEEESNADYIPHQSVDNEETNRLIMEIINRLPEDQRLCILMYYYQEMSVAEIASALGLTVSNVKYKLSTARNSIKKGIEKLEKDGTKLYAVFPFALLPSVMAQAAQNVSAPAFSTVSATVSGSVATGTATVSKISTGGIGMIFKTTISKIIAAALVLVVVGGGVTAAVIIGHNNNNNMPTSPVASTQSNAESQKDNSSENNDTTSKSDISTESIFVESKSNDAYKYDLYTDHVVITKYTGKDEAVVIPQTIEGQPVTVLGEDSFKSNKTMTSVTIPETVTEIGVNAFGFCNGLTDIQIPSSVRILNVGAFKYCENLENIAFSGNIEIIERNVFQDTKWEKNLPDGLTYIDKVLYVYKGEMPQNTKIDIKEGTVSVGGGAFYNEGDNYENLVAVTFPDTLTTLSEYAFYGCSGLTSIKLPDSVTTFGNGVFFDCFGLTSVELSANLKTFGEGAFSQCNSLTSITIPEGATEISESMFYGCDGLSDIDIPNSVKSIGRKAFAFCKDLKDVTIPEGVECIETEAFYACTNLKHISLPDTLTTIERIAFASCESLESIEIPGSMTELQSQTFINCTNLENIVIPESVICIGTCVFEETKWYNNQPDGLIYINHVLYKYKGEMPANTKMEIKEGTISIANGAFYDYDGTNSADREGLTEVVIPDTVIRIGDSAFGRCINLEKAVIPSSVTDIDISIFYGCDKVTIYGEKGSAIETYAQKNNLPFVVQ